MQPLTFNHSFYEVFFFMRRIVSISFPLLLKFYVALLMASLEVKF